MPVSCHRIVRIAVSSAVIAIALIGCAPRGPMWLDNGAVYSSGSVGALIDAADTTILVDRPTTDAPQLRHKALTELRKSGADAALVADLLTDTFEPSTRGVPVYVERASVDGTAAVIVVEATGPKSGKLSAKRLWVLSEDGDVILARSR